jgi:hypothetical protein
MPEHLMKTSKNTLCLSVLFLCIIGLTSCGALDSGFQYFAWHSKPAGFFTGVWHGFIALFSVVVSAFTSNVRMYEANNIGFCYDFGFICGIILSFEFFFGKSH